MPKILPILCLAVLLSGCLLSASAQERDNPFELEPRLQAEPSRDRSAAADADTALEEASRNPFELIREPGVAPVRPALPFAADSAAPATPAERYRRVKLFVILGILVLLAFLATVLRSLVRKSFMAFSNENLMNQLYREQEGRGILPFWLLYGPLFFINAGVFIFFLLRYYEIPFFADRPITELGLCIAGVAAFFFFKHLLLRFLAFVFPIEKEIARYQFTIIIFGIVIGLVLVPANIFLAYADPEVIRLVIWSSLGLIGLIYFFRYLRSLLIANKFLLFHKFHFLLYICTVEIAPVLFLLKLALSYL